MRLTVLCLYICFIVYSTLLAKNVFTNDDVDTVCEAKSLNPVYTIQPVVKPVVQRV